MAFVFRVINIWSFYLNEITIEAMSDPFYLDQCTALFIQFPLTATPSWKILGKKFTVRRKTFFSSLMLLKKLWTMLR